MNIKIICAKEELGRLADCAFKIYIDKSNEEKSIENILLIVSIIVWV